MLPGDCEESGLCLCTCDCHNHSRDIVAHMIACCEECPHCNRNVARGFLKIHLKNCSSAVAAQKKVNLLDK